MNAINGVVTYKNVAMVPRSIEFPQDLQTEPNAIHSRSRNPPPCRAWMQLPATRPRQPAQPTWKAPTKPLCPSSPSPRRVWLHRRGSPGVSKPRRGTDSPRSSPVNENTLWWKFRQFWWSSRRAVLTIGRLPWGMWTNINVCWLWNVYIKFRLRIWGNVLKSRIEYRKVLFGAVLRKWRLCLFFVLLPSIYFLL